MTAQYDADQASNWQFATSDSFAVTYRQGKQTSIYTPIPNQKISGNFSSKLLAIHCTSTDYPKEIKYLGRIVQAVNNPGNLPTSIATGHGVSLYSNQTVLADFTQFDDTYGLLLMAKYWVEQISIRVYEYIGSELYELEERLNVIEGKIDQLL